jgi:S-DNA-T family DNA segregation ATPase FtsK/SpoIIIE
MSAHEEIENDERALSRYARASWDLASQGARRHVERAREWVRAEGLEDHMRAQEVKQMSARNERASKQRARMSKRARASAHPPAPVRAMSDLELKSRAFGTRALRSLGALSVPCAVAAYPVWSLAQGDPVPLLLWPSAYGYLVWDGWMFLNREEKRAEGDERTEPLPVENGKVPVFRPQRLTELPPTAEEVQIIHRIDTWAERAEERKLQDVVPQHPVIDESGLLIPMDLTGQWTREKLGGQVSQIRALLAVPDGIQTQVKPGGTADRAVLRVRTRIRDLDLAWNPERKGLGLDADTAEIITIDITDRILVAGMSGAGKSVVLRTLMAEVLGLIHTVVVIIDLKVEGALWAHCARVESKKGGIEGLVSELIAEMEEREDIMRERGMDLWEPTAERPRIVVVVDEGAELIGGVPDCIDRIRTLAVRARSSQMPVWWATQKPTVTGAGRGLDTMISAQLTTIICLAVTSPQESRTVLGEDATANGWDADELLKGGWALVRTQGERKVPNPARVWFMTKEDVKAIPPREAWRRKKAGVEAVPHILAVALKLSEGLQGVSTAQLVSVLGFTDTEVHTRLRALGASPEPNAFAMGNGDKARGYRRSVLESALMTVRGQYEA